MRTIKRVDLAAYGTPIYRQAVRRHQTADPTGRDLYIGGQRPSPWPWNWRTVLAGGLVLLLCAAAWYLIFWAIWALEGNWK